MDSLVTHTGSSTRCWAVAVATAGLLVLAASAALAQHVGAGGGGHGGALAGGHAGMPAHGAANQHLDSKFSHNQYYYNRGYTVHNPPAGGVGELRGPDGGRYWYHGGNWYRWRNNGWVIWGAPIGLYVPFLPLYYTTVWWYGVPYFYANDTYYIWDSDQNSYEVVTPPDGIETDGTTQPPANDELFAYPKNGQSADQQAKDRFECHQWAVSQTEYDPAAPPAGVVADKLTALRARYFRAQAACLEGRGYTVR